jgi:D-tyrosyl-tRNA(Tyr) deacylase
MRLLIQRVLQARVEVDNVRVGAIKNGLLVFVCAMDEEPVDFDSWAKRLCALRLFNDAAGRMNQNLIETSGELLLVPQFTLSADMKKGLRPSFARASSPALAKGQIEALAKACEKQGVKVSSGRFGADMKVHLINDGPVTVFIDKN